ncbi:hypothetical protein ABEX53_30150 [Bacillus toyonensis]|uniref:hypothetical protein n=1 Tax=Bacillus toyonensis TaxID=155322 RepID=UPI000CD84273|nr:hypothetical protein [Bacillus toyonensis]MED3542338.1 hypothetical protein [Bacillus toyonensis]MEE2020784.1 hypothetical protein [Bacillus toyonensis]
MDSSKFTPSDVNPSTISYEVDLLPNSTVKLEFLGNIDGSIVVLGAVILHNPTRFTEIKEGSFTISIYPFEYSGVRYLILPFRRINKGNNRIHFPKNFKHPQVCKNSYSL